MQYFPLRSLDEGYSIGMQHSPKINADMWVDQYGDSLFHFALARVKNKEIAEDLVQETKERIKKALRAAP
jgi:hypothetical protein